MNKSLFRGAALLGCAAVSSFPHDPITTKITWTQEVSRIVYKRCAGCHRPGGPAMSLLSYDEARPWAKAIRDQVLARRMPPWGAVAGVGDFAGDPSLSTPEIDILVNWIEGGAPEGDPVYLPHRVPGTDAEKTVPPHYSGSVTVAGRLTLRNAVTLLAIRPAGIREGGSLEAWAIRPDQSVQRLLWLRDYRKAFDRTYVFRVPEKFPAGTVLRAEGATAVLLH